MLEYGQPIIVALIIFIIIAVISFIPWLVYIYRKLGYFPPTSTLIVFSFIFYFLAAFLLTMLPLPETRNNCIVPSGKSYSLVPFQFVKDLMRETNVVWSQPSTYTAILKERAFFQAFFNLLLLMPFGIYLRYFFQKRTAWRKAALLVFAVTLFYEITQLTAIYGIYACPYRLFDIDDLILNTSGGIIGFFIAPILLNLFPSRASVKQKALELMHKDEVRNMPVLIAVLIDLGCVHVSSLIVSVLTGSNDMWSMFIIKTVMLLLFLVVIPLMRKGRTLGSQFMRFRYSKERLWRGLVKRMLAIFLIYAISFGARILQGSEVAFESDLYLLNIALSLLGWIISFILTIIIIIHVFMVLISKEQRKFFFDAYAGVTTTRKALEDHEANDEPAANENDSASSQVDSSEAQMNK